MIAKELADAKKTLYQQLDLYWAKLESLLVTPQTRGDMLRGFSNQLRDATHEGRSELILDNYGSAYNLRCEPLLSQIHSIENELAKLALIVAK